MAIIITHCVSSSSQLSFHREVQVHDVTDESAGTQWRHQDPGRLCAGADGDGFGRAVGFGVAAVAASHGWALTSAYNSMSRVRQPRSRFRLLGHGFSLHLDYLP